MGAKRIFILILFSAVLIFLWTELYLMLGETAGLKKTMSELNASHEKLVNENNVLEQDVSYYSTPENIEKFLRNQFNYKKPGEKMIIIIPGE